MSNASLSTPFYQKLDAAIAGLGGMFNAHLHLDRAGTLDEVYMEEAGHRILENSHVSLHEKHSLITELHKGRAYESNDLDERVNAYLDVMIAVNTTRADTLVDVTADGVDLSALRAMLKIKRRRAKDIDMRVGAYSPLGFTDAEPQRWELLVEGAEQADFIGSLPEADDVREYPHNIGLYEHLKRVLLLAQKLKKLVHVQLDQPNDPTECGTEQL